MSVTVLRLSSLGDVVLTGAITASIGEVQLITSERYREIAERLVGVRSVHAPTQLPNSSLTIDLQNTLQSRIITQKLRAPTKRVRRWDWTRRSRVWFKTHPAPLVVERYAQAAEVSVFRGPWIELPIEHQGLAIFPMSQHPTKCWPAERYIELGRRWGGNITLIGSRSERLMLEHMARDIGPKASAVANNGFEDCLRALRRTHIAVGNDTGWIHIAAATGRPVLGIFGSTTSVDGFWCHQGAVVERALPCRPCNRFGGSHCARGDLACLNELSVDEVWQSLMLMEAECAG